MTLFRSKRRRDRSVVAIDREDDDGVTQPHGVDSTYPIPSPSVRSFGGVGRSHQSARLSNPPFVRPHVRTSARSFVRSFVARVVALCGASRV